MRKILSRTREVRREEGIAEVFRRAPMYLFNKYMMWRRPYHSWNRTDSEARSKAIRESLEENDNSAIDIGCASGFFTKEMSDEGMFSIGVEQDRNRLKESKRLYGRKEGLAFSFFEVSPDNVDHLPEVDVCLLLTVYHHWTHNFGSDGAEEMLKILGLKSEKIFFELPKDLDKNNMFNSSFKIDSGPTWIENHKYFLREVLGDVEVKFLHEADYPFEEERTDLMFLVDCSEIQSLEDI